MTGFSDVEVCDLPVIGIPCTVVRDPFKEHGVIVRHSVQEKYVASVVDHFPCVPFFLPAVAGLGQIGIQDIIDGWLGIVDGILLTGAVANVAPHFYQSDYQEDPNKLDLQRDGTSLPLIDKAIQRGIPLLGICRGLQEMNVARGGSLYSRIQEVEGHFDHREPESSTHEDRYVDAHNILIQEGGLFEKICQESCQGEGRFFVNSLHEQGISRPGRGVFVEARAEDGVIEAISIPEALAFCVGVQWHPEWSHKTHSLNRAIYDHFAGACATHKYAKLKRIKL